MNFLKITGRDLKSIFTNKFIRISVIAIIVVPLLYSLFYLYAFWDPYSRIQDLHVAVVNLDKGGVKDSETVNYGNKITDKLKDNKKVGWKIVSLDEAREGLNGSKYYAEFIIPENFSEEVLSADGHNIKKASIKYISNDKKNFIASQINNNIMKELKADVTKTISNQYAKVAFYGLNEAKDGMNEAKDGADKLNNGIVAADDGSFKLANGTILLKNNSSKFIDVILKLDKGSDYLKRGLISLKDGAWRLSNGTSLAKNGIMNFKDGVYKLDYSINTNDVDSNGMPVGLVNGASKVGQGIKELNFAISRKDTDSNGNPLGLAAGVQEIAADVDTNARDSYGNPLGLGDAVSSLYTNVAGKNGLADGVNEIYKDVAVGNSSLGSGVKNIYTSAVKGNQTLSNGTQAVYEGLTKKSNDPSQDGLGDSTANVNKLINAASAYLAKGDPTSIAVAKQLLSQAGQISAGLTYQTNMHSQNPNNPTFLDGVTAVNEGVKESSQKIDSALGTLNAGVNGYTKQDGTKVPGLVTAVSALNAGVNAGGLKGAVAKLNTAVNGDGSSNTPSLRNALNTLNTNINVKSSSGPSLAAAVNMLDTSVNGSSGLVQGTKLLGDSVSGQLVPGTDILYNSSTEMADGAGALYNGAGSAESGGAELNDALDKVYAGMPQISKGVSDISDGASNLNQGLDKIKSGSGELSSKIGDGADKMNNNLKNSSTDMAEFISQPLNMKISPVNSVKNYGTGFTPYFIPLSLWVGAIMMFFVIKENVDDDVKGSSASVVVGKFLSYACIGILQASLASVIVLCLGLNPNNMLMYFVFNIFMSFVFISIIQCLVFLMGKVGVLLAIILLILQLTSCAGTFPLEVVPKFFRVINPYMPFTYCDEALREIISGHNYLVVWKDCGILFAVMVVFMVISILLRNRAEVVKKKVRRKVGAAVV